MLRRDPLAAQWREAARLLALPEAQTAALPALVRQTFRRGGVLAVARGGETLLLPLGGVAADGVFELASVTKPFTVALAAALVREGRLEWHTPLARLGGPLRRLPRTLTPYALATHTAGLPPHPARAALTALTQFSDPYGGMSPGAVLASARRWASPGPASSPQTGRFSYSNLGAGVLALASAYAAGEDLSAAGYERALRHSVTGPLGLPGVGLTPAREVVPPYGLLGGREVTGFAELAGAGGLFGTAADLLRFGEAHLRGTVGQHWQDARPFAGLPPLWSGVAPGWFHSGGVVWHDGVARGTRTALGFAPRSGAVAALLVRGGVPLVGARGAVPVLLLGLLGGGEG